MIGNLELCNKEILTKSFPNLEEKKHRAKNTVTNCLSSGHSLHETSR